jgi:hypothetical protein
MAILRLALLGVNKFSLINNIIDFGVKIKINLINDQVPAYTNEDSQGTQLHTWPEEIRWQKLLLIIYLKNT